jgi:hypothetical protein
MLRVLGLFAVAGGAAYLAMHHGVIAGYDLTNIPLEMVAFLVATAGLIYSLRHI